MESINVKIDDSFTERKEDVRDNVGTSYVQTVESLREEICEFTNTESMNSQSSTCLSTEGHIKHFMELVTNHPDEGSIIDVKQKISNADGSFFEMMLKRCDIKRDVMTFHTEDLDFFRYLIQHD